ncbi:hypothetical protein [Streptomyces sp. SLBN-118]|uniref:hypothetical protein n=1 Tax=Streptomyces sp. SLBN-118 TaxID=2768454 RepID=UPI001150B27B|nr:hypothetical protein [Streptomyces sp. SLBN-118]
MATADVTVHMPEGPLNVALHHTIGRTALPEPPADFEVMAAGQHRPSHPGAVRPHPGAARRGPATSDDHLAQIAGGRGSGARSGVFGKPENARRASWAGCRGAWRVAGG